MPDRYRFGPLAGSPGAPMVETWFTQAAPAPRELGSIIVPCCNQVAYTRLCLDSVLRHTRRPFELVLVDNGSTDGTLDLLQQAAAHSAAERVVVIRNPENRGFPAACNQGLAQARGTYISFLNNDTVVTPNWLEGLIAWSRHDWPQVGLVGAVTNYSRPPQQIAVPYADLAGLDDFARDRAAEYAGKAMQVQRLTGFCLLARREVLDRIGGFDERYGLGFFDDDDLSVRALRAGYRLLVALNVFIHHFGSRTFAGLGVDGERQLRDNLARFRDKWGEDEARGYRLPDGSEALRATGPAAAPPPAGGVTAPPAPDQVVVAPIPSREGGSPESVQAVRRATVSLTLIVKNEEANLPACLESARGLFDEIVVVDTGSTDRTREIAASSGARVFDFPWVDSFAAARNEGLRHATGDWVFWLDADDRLDEANRAKLRAVIAELSDEVAAYVLKCHCLPDHDTGQATVVDHVRLFRRHPEVRWEYRVHEQVLPSLRRLGAAVRWADVVIQHTGYQDPAARQRKRERDLRLLLRELAEQPDDPFTLFNLASIYHEQGHAAEALPLLRRSLDRSAPSASIVRKLYALVVQCHRLLGELAAAREACQAGRAHYPDDAELLFQEGLLRREQGDRPGARACFERLLAVREADHFASIDAGLRGHKARHNLAVLAFEEQAFAAAEAEWRAALGDCPGFTPAWQGLGEVYLAQQRWRDLEEVLARLSAHPSSAGGARLLRAQAHLARREFAAARAELDQAIRESPQAAWPRVLLSRAWLQEGTDLQAALAALRAVLALAPDHPEARANLARLQADSGTSGDPSA